MTPAQLRRLEAIEQRACRLAPPAGLDLPSWFEWLDHDELTAIESICHLAADGAPLDEARLMAIEAEARQRELAWPAWPWDAITRLDSPWWRVYGRAHYDRLKGTSLAAWVYARMTEVETGVIHLADRRST